MNDIKKNNISQSTEKDLNPNESFKQVDVSQNAEKDLNPNESFKQADVSQNAEKDLKTPHTHSMYKASTNTDLQTEHTRIISNQNTVIMQFKLAKKSPASLLLLNGPRNLIGQSWVLKTDVTDIGRSKTQNTIMINYESLSKKHFQIIKKNTDFYVMDLKSTNKTYINDQLLKPYEKVKLTDSDYIYASSLIFKFLAKGNIESFSSLHILNKSQTDPLTKAGNRQILKTKGHEYFLLHKLSLIVFDIDDFKKTNDTLGHLAGDYVLQMLAKCVLSTIREKDLFVRYGGDEFCIFTPQSLESSQQMSNRILEKIEKTDFIFNNKKVDVQISIGVSEKQLEDQSWKDIYLRADSLSYKEKKRKKLNKKL